MQYVKCLKSINRVNFQIIENCTSLTDASTGRRRKRPTPSNSADLSMQIEVEYKDHSKSIPYSVGFKNL